MDSGILGKMCAYLFIFLQCLTLMAVSSQLAGSSFPESDRRTLEQEVEQLKDTVMRMALGENNRIYHHVVQGTR